MKKKSLIATISHNNLEFLKKLIIESDLIDESDLLIIDDASEYDIFEELTEFKKIKCISNEKELGVGACLSTSINYFNNFEYDYLVFLDSNSTSSLSDYSNILSNLEYGYDLVSCSRILENFDYDKLDQHAIEITETISQNLNSIIEDTITDPLSFNKGISKELAKKIQITENNSNSMLQLFIQSHYYGCTVIEIPSESAHGFGSELSEEDLIKEALNVLETEKYLYNKGTIN